MKKTDFMNYRSYILLETLLHLGKSNTWMIPKGTTSSNGDIREGKRKKTIKQKINDQNKRKPLPGYKRDNWIGTFGYQLNWYEILIRFYVLKLFAIMYARNKDIYVHLNNQNG